MLLLLLLCGSCCCRRTSCSRRSRPHRRVEGHQTQGGPRRHGAGLRSVHTQTRMPINIFLPTALEEMVERDKCLRSLDEVVGSCRNPAQYAPFRMFITMGICIDAMRAASGQFARESTTIVATSIFKISYILASELKV